MTTEQQELLAQMREIVKERNEAVAMLEQMRRQTVASMSDSARRASLAGGFAVIRVALETMKNKTPYYSVACLAMDALNPIEREFLK